MAVLFVPAERLKACWHDLELGNGESIRLLMRRPTPRDTLDTLRHIPGESRGGFQMRRAEMLIQDWDEVTQEVEIDGEVFTRPMGYTFSALCTLLQQFPGAVWHLVALCNEISSGITETERKNWPLPPAAGGKIVPDELPNSSGCSTPGDSTSEENSFASPAD